MFSQVVIGVDERDGGRDPTILAKQLCAQDGEFTLAHVYERDSFFDCDVSARVLDPEHHRGLKMLEQTAEEAGIGAHLQWRGAPSVGQGLHELCETIDADLLVVGTSHRGLLGRALIGDGTRAVLNGATCAIAIAPAGYARCCAVIRTIGVGYDGSPESEHALELAQRLAADIGAKLSAFAAIVVLPAAYFTAGRTAVHDAVNAVLADARERITARYGVEAHAAYGDAAEELGFYSGSLDLLVVGSRGYGPIGRLFHGSTTRELARLARCPLLVLPRSARMIEADDPAARQRDRVAAN